MLVVQLNKLKQIFNNKTDLTITQYETVYINVKQNSKL